MSPSSALNKLSPSSHSPGHAPSPGRLTPLAPLVSPHKGKALPPLGSVAKALGGPLGVLSAVRSAGASSAAPLGGASLSAQAPPDAARPGQLQRPSVGPTTARAAEVEQSSAKRAAIASEREQQPRASEPEGDESENDTVVPTDIASMEAPPSTDEAAIVEDVGERAGESVDDGASASSLNSRMMEERRKAAAVSSQIPDPPASIEGADAARPAGELPGAGARV